MEYAGYAGGISAIGSISSAFASYEAGKSRQLAYQHEAAMNALNARQVGIDAQFIIADKMNELTNNLAMQQVVAAAQGRSGGSVEALYKTSVSNFRKEEERLLKTGKARSASMMMESDISRATGKSAATAGLLGATSDLAAGLATTAKYFAPLKTTKED